MGVSIPFDLGTSGASSPISLSGAPVSSASNPITSFGNFQVGGKGNDASATQVPTPNTLLSPQQIGGITGLTPVMLIAGVFILFAVYKAVHG